jgi:hypothetical protein
LSVDRFTQATTKNPVKTRKEDKIRGLLKCNPSGRKERAVKIRIALALLLWQELFSPSARKTLGCLRKHYTTAAMTPSG